MDGELMFRCNLTNSFDNIAESSSFIDRRHCCLPIALKNDAQFSIDIFQWNRFFVQSRRF